MSFFFDSDPSDLHVFGRISPTPQSESQLGDPRGVVPEHVERDARLHEENGFDGVLVGAGTRHPDSLQLAAFAAARTKNLKFLVAHRPHTTLPTAAARQFATLDRLSDGRLIVHAITGRDGEQEQEGDTLSKDERYRRTHENIQILKQAWTADEPFDHDGEHYHFANFRSNVLPSQKPRIPISFAGESSGSHAVGAADADQYLFYAQPYEDLKVTIDDVFDQARAQGRTAPLRVGVIVRPILAETDELAWERANSILEKIEGLTASKGPAYVNFLKQHDKPSAGEQLLLEAHARGDRHDRALWTGIAGATNRAMTASVVGSPATVADALAGYVELGARMLLLFGYEPYEDVIRIGRDLIPLIRERASSIPFKEPLGEPALR